MHPSTPPGRVVIAGGSGFIGSSLTAHLLATGREVVVLSRSGAAPPGARGVRWDARTPGEWKRELNHAAALVNLVGRTVDCIKTPDHCDEILRSRVEATRILGQAVRTIDHPPPVWVQMSTAHIVGDPPDIICDEDSPPGLGLAPAVGKAWESAFDEARPPHIRGVVLRTSFVLGRRGGALTRLKKLAGLGLGGRIGHGRQGISWIHERDMNRLFERAITDDSFRGVYLATAPNPVSNAAFMRTLRRAIGMPLGLPAPAFMVRLGAPLLLRTDPELAIYGRYCVSKRLKEDGFEFEFPELEGAMRELIRG